MTSRAIERFRRRVLSTWRPPHSRSKDAGGGSSARSLSTEGRQHRYSLASCDKGHYHIFGGGRSRLLRPPGLASPWGQHASRRPLTPQKPPANCMDWVDYQSSNDRERDRPKEEQRGAFWQNEPNSLNIFEVVLHRERRRAWGEAPKIRSSEGRLLCSIGKAAGATVEARKISRAHHRWGSPRYEEPSSELRAATSLTTPNDFAIRRALEEAGAGPRRDAGLRVFLILTKLPSSVQSSGGVSPTKVRPVYQSPG
jgi:hypothetical protein